MTKAEIQKLKGRWHHKGGYFTVWVTDVVENDKGLWFTFFNEQNCDNTFAEHADALHGEAVVKKHWYDSNFLQVMHEDRFNSKHRQHEVPAAEIRIKHYDEFGNEIVHAEPVAKEPSASTTP